MQNKIAEFLLSVMIAFLGALCLFLNGNDIGKTNKIITRQELQVVEIELQMHSEPELQIIIKEIKSDYEIALEEMNKKLEDTNSITNQKEWFLEYKSILQEYEDIIDPPETIYDCFTEDELDLLFCTVQAEIGEEYSFEQKTNVASVIFNRVKHDRFPDTLSEVLIPSQFASISDGRYKNVEVSEDTILACEYAFQIKDTARGCLFFDSNNKLKYEFIFTDGAHNFYTLKEENNGGDLVLLQE